MATVELLPAAQQMLAELDGRWNDEHSFVNNPLFDDIEHASDLLCDNPQLGVICERRPDGEIVRRLLLRTGWHLYYSYDEPQQLVSIVAIWFASRGGRPPR